MMQAIGTGSCDVIRLKGSSPGKDNDDLKTIQNRYEAEIQSLSQKLEAQEKLLNEIEL